MSRTWIDWFGEVLGQCKLTGCGDLLNARDDFFTFFTSSSGPIAVESRSKSLSEPTHGKDLMDDRRIAAIPLKDRAGRTVNL
jgi:hypothetical protein